MWVTRYILSHLLILKKKNFNLMRFLLLKYIIYYAPSLFVPIFLT